MEQDGLIVLLMGNALAVLACGFAAGWDARSSKTAWSISWGLIAAANLAVLMTVGTII